MQARLVRRRHRFVIVDWPSVVVYSALAIVIIVCVGNALIASGIVKSFYASPFVMLCALIANRVCLRAGLLTAVLAIVAHEYWFASPYGEINFPTPEQSLAYASNFIAAWLVARRMPAPPLDTVPKPDNRPLPFTHVDKGGGSSPRLFWHVHSSSDWLEDCDVGAEYGRIYLGHLRAGHAFPPLGWIIRDMIARGQFTGVEHGFASVVGQAAAESESSAAQYLNLGRNNDTDEMRAH